MSDLGWHVISGERLLEALCEAAESGSPETLFAELWANADHGTRRGVELESCMDCDQHYACWYADNNLWNAVMYPDGSGMLCPTCFLLRAEPVTEIARVTWPETQSKRDRHRDEVLAAQYEAVSTPQLLARVVMLDEEDYDDSLIERRDLRLELLRRDRGAS